MSIKPIDFQVTVTKSQELVKTQELNSDKFLQQEIFKGEMQKKAEKELNEVKKSSESERLIDEKPHEESKSKYHKKEDEEEKQKEKKRKDEEFFRNCTKQGTRFDFEA